jgi:hypothetical protein
VLERPETLLAGGSGRVVGHGLGGQQRSRVDHAEAPAIESDAAPKLPDYLVVEVRSGQPGLAQLLDRPQGRSRVQLDATSPGNRCGLAANPAFVG